MIEDIHIKDFALIHETSLDFDTGFTVLSGETGAGKSILIGAVSFLLGGKASLDVIRKGKAPHLIKIILAYSPKKKRADPIEDESEVQQGHFCPPPFSRNRTWTLPLIQLPASKQLAFLYKEWKCG